MPFMANPDPDPARKPSVGQLIDSRFELDDQTFEALSTQHTRLAARVSALESTVAVLEGLVTGQ
jgi:hypothetical protein